MFIEKLLLMFYSHMLVFSKSWKFCQFVSVAFLSHHDKLIEISRDLSIWRMNHFYSSVRLSILRKNHTFPFCLRDSFHYINWRADSLVTFENLPWSVPKGIHILMSSDTCFVNFFFPYVHRCIVSLGGCIENASSSIPYPNHLPLLRSCSGLIFGWKTLADATCADVHPDTLFVELSRM